MHAGASPDRSRLSPPAARRLGRRHRPRRSIATYPRPEAHTFLGWAYAIMARYEEAIAECEKAIALDATFWQSL